MRTVNLFLATAGLLLAGAASAAEFLPVCERTAPVKAFLEVQLGKTCDLIAEEDLAAVKRVAVPNRQIREFKVGDFSGLPSLEILNIKGNPYTHLPEGLFAGLPNLKTIVIFRTGLVELPTDFLVGLPALENVHVFGNPFTTVSAEIIERLASLENLQVLDFNDNLQQAQKDQITASFDPDRGVQVNFF